MNTRLIAALIVGSFVLAGCGGGGSSDSAMDMEDETPQVSETDQDRIDELQDQLTAAQQQAQQAEAARLQAEQEAAEAAARANRADARAAHTGLRGTAAVGTVAVIPRYAAAADVSVTVNNNPVNFASKSRSSASGWSVTTLSNAGFTHNDDLVVYSNRGPATRVLLTSEMSGYSDRFSDALDDPDTMAVEIQATVANTPADGRLIRSGSFPTTDGDDRTFQKNFENDDGNMGPDIVRFSGTFAGASGYFHCTGQDDCTIGRRGDRYTLESGTWTFHTTDTARALIDDKSYMYFGWWKREQKSDETQSFQTFYDVTNAHSATEDNGDNFDLLTGSATYRGPAIGQYAIYQPLGAQSDSGSFTASAVLTADFSNDLLSGTVTGFSNDPNWSLTLNAQSMEGGDVSGGTTDWTISGNTSRRQGAWEAEFFSESPYVGQVPDAVVGEFTAIYDGDTDMDEDIGRIVGAFGARK